MAEVLITLGIIGMVAQMTIPTLMAGVEKQQTVVRLQKAYSELAQTKALAEVDNGMVANWDFADASLDATKHYVDNYVYPYMKTIKKCDNGDTSCWKDTVSLNNMPSSVAWGPAASSAFGVSAIMAGGYSVYFVTIGLAAAPYVYVYIDIDGPTKGPGRYGRDVFGYRARFLSAGNGNLRPIGWSDISPIKREDAVGYANYGCSNAITGGSAGVYCAALIMADNWKIADDYPWK